MATPKTLGELCDAGAPMSAVYAAVLDLHRVLKEGTVKDRVWRYAWTHDRRSYELKLNGYVGRDVDHIPPVGLAIECDGWLRFLAQPFGGGTVVGGPDTEDFIIAALKAETAKVRQFPETVA